MEELEQWRSRINMVKNKNGDYVCEGDLVRCNRKLWFVDMLERDTAWLVRFKDHQFNPGILEYDVVKVAALRPLGRGSNFAKFLKGVYCSYAVNMKPMAAKILNGIVSYGDFVKTYNFKQLKNNTLCQIENYSVFSPCCYVSAFIDTTQPFKNFIVPNKRLLKDDVHNLSDVIERQWFRVLKASQVKEF